ncbi:MAG TPA: hypothetical protein ENO20_00880 [Bacteroides sp.]|nr:hypothetical protein [Bacteroides sp.]
MYTFERYNFRIITLVLGLVAIAFFVNSGFIGGFLFTALGILLSFSYQGIIIDPVNALYRKYDRFMWIKIGGWTPLPEPSYVTVVRINLSSNRNLPTPLVPPDTKSARSYKVNLVVEGDQRYVSVCRGPRKEMTEEALKLGKLLHIRVLDYTTHEKKWIL